MKHGRKISGGKYRKSRKKKLYELPGQRREVKLGEEKRKTQIVLGRNKKTFLLKAKLVNVKIGNKIQKMEIKNVLETPSNRFLARQNLGIVLVVVLVLEQKPIPTTDESDDELAAFAVTAERSENWATK